MVSGKQPNIINFYEFYEVKKSMTANTPLKNSTHDALDQLDLHVTSKLIILDLYLDIVLCCFLMF